nr:immunoglobulin light chain junction region [Macaca mulatta]MOV63966.1 immunoglobulin light chain junction region [Macaca mulatta]
CQQHNTFPRTF